MDRLAAHTNINSKYMQVGQTVDDGAAVLVRRFGLAVRIAQIEDVKRTKLLRVGVDVTNWPFNDRRQIVTRGTMRLASDFIARGHSLGYMFSVLARTEHLKDQVELQQVFAVVERHLSWIYDPQTNQRRREALPFISI